MAMVERAFPHPWLPDDHHTSKSEHKERNFASMRVTRARAMRTPMTEIKISPRTEITTPISQSRGVNEGSRLTSLDEEAPAPVPSNHVTPVVEEGSSVIFMNAQPGLSPLILKRMRMDNKNDDPDYGKLPMEFVLGPLPGPPAPKKRKFLVSTSSKRANGAPNPNSNPIHPRRSRVAPVKWAPPLRFPSTSTSPIRRFSTEWDDDDEDADERIPTDQRNHPPATGLTTMRGVGRDAVEVIGLRV